MTASVSLKSLLRTGHFGNIKLGLDRNDVAQLLGKHDDVGGTSRKYSRPGIWKYGDVELFFDRQTERLSLIVINFWEPKIPTGGVGIHLDPWIIAGGLRMSDLQAALQAEGITYEELRPIQPGTRQLMVNSSSSFVFKEDEEEFPDWLGLCKVVLARV